MGTAAVEPVRVPAFDAVHAGGRARGVCDGVPLRPNRCVAAAAAGFNVAPIMDFPPVCPRVVAVRDIASTTRPWPFPPPMDWKSSGAECVPHS